MKVERTPSPWHLEGQKIVAGPRVIARMARYPTRDTQQANAAYIVRACNGHEELLEASEKAKDALTILIGQYKAYELPPGVSEIGALGAVCAAIAKATGE